MARMTIAQLQAQVAELENKVSRMSASSSRSRRVACGNCSTRANTVYHNSVAEVRACYKAQ